MKAIAEANAAIRKFLKKEQQTAYVDIWNDMLDSEGAPREELFLSDMLHMNEKGYAIWQKRLAPHLK